MRRRIEVGCFFLLIAASAIPARADLVISFSSPSVPQGGTGELDVFLSSDAPSGTPDMINNYSFTLQITPNTVGNLAFSDTQGFGYLNDSNYVFFGNSADHYRRASTLRRHAPSTLDRRTATPMTPSSASITRTTSLRSRSRSASGTVLLAKLTLDASITSAGETFTVSLVPPTGNGSQANGASTYFDVVVDNHLNEILRRPLHEHSRHGDHHGGSRPRAVLRRLCPDRRRDSGLLPGRAAILQTDDVSPEWRVIARVPGRQRCTV